MAFIALLFSLVPAYNILSVCSDQAIQSIIASSVSSTLAQFTLTSVHSLRNSSFSLNSIELIIALPNNKLEESNLSSLAETFKIPTFLLARGSDKNFTFYSDFPETCYSDTIASLANHFALSDFYVLWPFSEENQAVIKNLKSKSNLHLNHISFLNTSSKDEVSSTMNKILKKEAVQNYVFLPHDDFCLILGESFKMSYLDVKGNFAVFFTTCLYQVKFDGALVLTHKDYEGVKNKSEYFSKKIKSFINNFTDFQLGLSKKLIQICEFSVINIRNSTGVIVGSVKNNKVSIESPVIYPGGILDRKNYSTPIITLSADTGSFDIGINVSSLSNKRYQEGTYFAVEKINRDRIYFPKYKLSLYDEVNCGVTVFNYSYALGCFKKHRAYMGLAYIPSNSGVYIQQSGLLASLNMSLPSVGGALAIGPLSNKTTFPYFVRVVSPSLMYITAWANLIRLFNWTQIVVLYSNEPFGIQAYNALEPLQKSYGFNIINDEESRSMNQSINSKNDIPFYYGQIKATLALGCNIYFLLLRDPTAFFILEAFYDLGIRRGELTFIFLPTLGLDSFTSIGGNSTKRKELFHGTFCIYTGDWVGDYGKNVKKEYLKYRNTTWARGYFLDAVYTLAETTDFLMKMGRTYEDINVFMKGLRDIKFLGTTGVVSFDTESNDRNLYNFNLFNFYEDSNGTWHDDAAALITPLGSVYYNHLQDIVWAGGTRPSSMKSKYLNCEFRVDQIRNSKTGETVKNIMSSVVVAISIFLTVFSSRKSRFKFEMMAVKSEMLFDDYLIFGFIFVEGLQLVSIGPSFADFNVFLNNLSELISLNISKFTNFRDTTFWVIFLTMLALSYLWILLLFFNRFKLGRLGFSDGWMGEFKKISIPVMSNYLFLPVIVSLVSILLCDKSIGSDITDSYLNYDCRLFCWSDLHILYAVLSCVQIVVYIPLAIFYRTLWQEENSLMNIKINPSYIIMKNLLVAVLVILGKLLKNDYPLVHSIIFLGTFVAMFLFVLYIKCPFNHDRSNVWCKAVNSVIIWNTLICILGNNVITRSFISVILQVVGIVIIFIAGLFYQNKLPPNLLYVKKGRSVVDLFRFEFGLISYKESAYIQDSPNFSENYNLNISSAKSN